MNNRTEAILTEIAAERTRQITVEGFDAKHDDEHTGGELALAAACYASPVRVFHAQQRAGRGYESFTVYLDLWPWEYKWWKPKLTRRENLVIAAALIVAEIERIDRADQ